MKRIVIWFCLISMMTFCIPAQAEWELPVINEDFTIRNGISFNMSLNEVLAKEQESGNSATIKDNHLELKNISFLGQDTTRLDYYFTKDNKLSSFTYHGLGTTWLEITNFSVYKSGSYYRFSDIKNLLTSKYGEPMLTTELSPFSTSLWMNELYYIDDTLVWSPDTLIGSGKTYSSDRTLWISNYAVWLIKYNDCAVVVELAEKNNGSGMGLGYAAISHEAMENWLAVRQQEIIQTQNSYNNDI